MKKENKINDFKNIDKNEINNEESKEVKRAECQGPDIENEHSGEIDKNEDVISEYEKKLKESTDRFIRLQADFENFRKRVSKEREDIYLYSLEEIMCQLLAVIDNFERALSSFKDGGLDIKYIEGLEMVYNNLLEILNKNGLSEIDAMNCIFDPNYHHAVMQEEAEDDDNVIKEIFQKGYMLNSKVIRPCMVKVAVKN